MLIRTTYRACIISPGLKKTLRVWGVTEGVLGSI